MNSTLTELSEKIDEYTPEDTFTLESNTKIHWAEEKDWKIVWEVYNTDPKAIYVEHGKNGKVFNYYKNSWRKRGWMPFYSGVGAHMFWRAKKDMEKKIKEKFTLITNNL